MSFSSRAGRTLMLAFLVLAAETMRISQYRPSLRSLPLIFKLRETRVAQQLTPTWGWSTNENHNSEGVAPILTRFEVAAGVGIKRELPTDEQTACIAHLLEFYRCAH
jgi:hypothetical protein